MMRDAMPMRRMRGRRGLRALFIIMALGSVTVPFAGSVAGELLPAGDATRQPHHVVRALSLLQERMAHGDETAVARQRDVVREIADALRAFPPAVWREPRNRLALIKYTLSGGDPTQLRAVHGQKLFTEDERPLAEGALAYAEGARAQALRHLERVNVFALPPSLAGHVALVMALVTANADLARVIRLSDEARLLSPGTLVEETALRLAMEAAIARGEQAKFERLASRYFRRFPRSPYLGAMIRPVAAAMVGHGHGETSESARWIHETVRDLAPQKLVQFYAALAEIALGEGRLATAINAARMVRKYARSGAPEYAWAEAHEGAALVVGLAPEEGLARLNAAEAAGVPPTVRDLIAGARAISHLIRSPPAASPAVAPAPTPVAAKLAAEASPASTDPSPVAARIQARVAQIDQVLKDIAP